MRNFDLLDPLANTHDLVVVVFDMCSSSNIVEDLSRTQNLTAFDRLLKNLHLWLWNNAKSSKYVVYKFTVERSLRNIGAGGRYRCVKVNLTGHLRS